MSWLNYPGAVSKKQTRLLSIDQHMEILPHWKTCFMSLELGKASLTQSAIMLLLENRWKMEADMDLRKRLETDLYQAMRENNEIAKNTIRIVLSSLKLAEVEKGHAFDEQEILSVIQKELKMRSESIEEFKRGGRLDLV